MGADRSSKKKKDSKRARSEKKKTKTDKAEEPPISQGEEELEQIEE